MAVIGGVLVVPVMEVGIAMIIVGLCMAVVFSVIGTVKKKQHDSEFIKTENVWSAASIPARGY